MAVRLEKKYLMSFIVLVALAAVNSTLGQVRVGGGGGLDANTRVGSRGINSAVRPGINPALNNQIISGNVTAGKVFRGIGGIGDPRSFQASLGTDSLSGFRRNSYGLPSGPSSYGVPRPFYLPSNTVLGVQGITSGAARSGSNMPQSTTLAPLGPRGPAQSRPNTGRASLYSGQQPVDNRVDLRAYRPGLSTQQKVVTASNLYGLRQFGPEITDEPDRPETLASGAQAVPRDLTRQGRQKDKPDRPTALPYWVQLPSPLDSQEPEADGEDGIPVPVLPGPTPSQTGEEQENGANLGPTTALPQSFLDVYQRMMEEVPAVSPALGSGDSGIVDITGQPEQDQPADGIAAKILHYNSFVGARKDGFNDYMAQGESLLKQGGYYQAARAYERATAIEPDNPLARLGKAHSLLGAGDLVSAADNLAMALEIFPKVGGRKINLPEFYYDQQEFDRIIQKLQARIEARQKDPRPQKDARLRLLLGYMYIYSGEVPLGTAALQEAVELAGEDPNISQEWARIIAQFAREIPKQESGQFEFLP